MSPPLGINNCFAVKRWPHADEWSELISGELGLDLVQHSFDLVDLSTGADDTGREAARVRDACERAGVTLHSTFTGLAAYSANLMLDPDPDARRRALGWYERAIDFTAALGAAATGGHVGSLSARDFADPERRALLWRELTESLAQLRLRAREAGLHALLVENMACAREPSTMAQFEALLDEGDPAHVPLALCLDVGHHCVPGTSGDERDPYAWLTRFGTRAAVIHLQQTDAGADHHWPFTAAYNAVGRIDAGRVLAALGDADTVLILEVIPSFEASDEDVLEDLRETVAHWRAAIADARGHHANEDRSC